MTVRIRQGGYGTRYANKLVISYHVPNGSPQKSKKVAKTFGSFRGPDFAVPMAPWLESLHASEAKLTRLKTEYSYYPTVQESIGEALNDLERLRSGEDLKVVEIKRGRGGEPVERLRYVWGWRCLRSSCFEGCPLRNQMILTPQQCPKRYIPARDETEPRILVVDDSWNEDEYARLSMLSEAPIWSQRVYNFRYVLFAFAFALRLDYSEAQESADEALDFDGEFNDFSPNDLLDGRNFLRLCFTRVKRFSGGYACPRWMTEPLQRSDAEDTAFWKLIAQESPEERICYVMDCLRHMRAEANRKLDRIWRIIDSLGPIKWLAQIILGDWLEQPASPLEIRISKPEIAVALGVYRGRDAAVGEVEDLIAKAEGLLFSVEGDRQTIASIVEALNKGEVPEALRNAFAQVEIDFPSAVTIEQLNRKKWLTDGYLVKRENGRLNVYTKGKLQYQWAKWKQLKSRR